MGLARQTENKTTLNKRTGRINWQVEWLPLGSLKQKTDERLLSKVMDDVPLYRAYHDSVEAQEKAANRERGVAVKYRRIGFQSPSDSTWLAQPSHLQEPTTGYWVTVSDGAADIPGLWPTEREREQSAQFSFFLREPQQRSDRPTAVTRVEADECLREALTNGTVLEYPSVYVLPKGETLPAGFVLAARAAAKLLPPTQGAKRKNERDQKGGGMNKKRRRDGADVENGEGDSDDREDDDGGPVGLEAGEVMAEESFDEDEGDEEDDDDSPTSSSGSDSDDTD
jgi:hypothetical protein